MLDLKIAPREGYVRGREGFEQFLRAALDLLIERGSKALTLRAIAERCGQKAGNLAHYFRSKEDLIRELLNAIIGGYEDAFDLIAKTPDESAERRLERLIELVLNDIGTKRTTRVFPELWAMANHDAFVQDRVEELYARARVAFKDLVAELNPHLPPDESALVAVFMSASLEGMTIFAGFEKPWCNNMPAIGMLASKSFIHLARSLQPGDVRQLNA